MTAQKFQGFATKENIHGLTTTEAAADEALELFDDHLTPLYFDNTWPSRRGLEDLISDTSRAGSCVLLLSALWAELAQNYTKHVVNLGTLRFDGPEGRETGTRILYSHLGRQPIHRGCTEANADDALSLLPELPIAADSPAMLIRIKLVCRLTSNSEQVHSPPASHPQPRASTFDGLCPLRRAQPGRGRDFIGAGPFRIARLGRPCTCAHAPVYLANDMRFAPPSSRHR